MRTLKRESVFWIMQKNKVRRREVVSNENNSEDYAYTSLTTLSFGHGKRCTLLVIATPLLANNEFSPENLAFATLHIAHHRRTWTK